MILCTRRSAAAPGLALVLALAPFDARPALAGAALQPLCDGSKVPVVRIDGKPGLVLPYRYVTGANDYPMAALPDVERVFHAKATIGPDRITLTSAEHTVVIDRTTGAITSDGTPPPPHAVSPPPKISHGVTYVGTEAAEDVAAHPTDPYPYPETDYPLYGVDGNRLVLPRICHPPAPTAREAAILNMARPTEPIALKASPWCDEGRLLITPYTIRTVLDPQRSPASYRNDAINTRAHAELCDGDLRAAARDYAALITYFVSPDGSKLVDFQRRYILTQSLAGNADAAFAVVTKIRKEDAGIAAGATAFFAGDVCAAMRLFAAGDASIGRDADGQQAYQRSGPSPKLGAAVTAACANDLHGAIALLKSLDDYALYELMIGNLEAREGDWAAAGTAWWRAAGNYGHVAAMEESDFDEGGPTALEMIWHYRAHLAPLRRAG